MDRRKQSAEGNSAPRSKAPVSEIVRPTPRSAPRRRGRRHSRNQQQRRRRGEAGETASSTTKSKLRHQQYRDQRRERHRDDHRQGIVAGAFAPARLGHGLVDGGGDRGGGEAPAYPLYAAQQEYRGHRGPDERYRRRDDHDDARQDDRALVDCDRRSSPEMMREPERHHREQADDEAGLEVASAELLDVGRQRRRQHVEPEAQQQVGGQQGDVTAGPDRVGRDGGCSRCLLRSGARSRAGRGFVRARPLRVVRGLRVAKKVSGRIGCGPRAIVPQRPTPQNPSIVGHLGSPRRRPRMCALFEQIRGTGRQAPFTRE